ATLSSLYATRLSPRQHHPFPTRRSSDLAQAAFAAISAALDCGINFFDHADIYTRGKSEEVFGRYLRDNPGLRDRLVLQSKVGIRDRKSTRLNSSHVKISYAVFCLKKKIN